MKIECSMKPGFEYLLRGSADSFTIDTARHVLKVGRKEYRLGWKKSNLERMYFSNKALSARFQRPISPYYFVGVEDRNAQTGLLSIDVIETDKAKELQEWLDLLQQNFRHEVTSDVTSNFQRTPY